MSDYYTIIPAQVRTDTRLLPLDKLIYGELFVLAKQTGFCWAQNSFFADVYGVRTETVSRSLKKLENTGYIQIEFEGKGNSGRRILPLDAKINTLDVQVKHNNKKNNKNEYACSFEQFWNAYPKKQNKANARKAFDKLGADQDLLNDILAALAWQTKLPDWTKDGGQYVPLASTYLNGRRWEDEPPAAATKPKAPKLKTIIDENGNEVAQFC